MYQTSRKNCNVKIMPATSNAPDSVASFYILLAVTSILAVDKFLLFFFFLSHFVLGKMEKNMDSDLKLITFTHGSKHFILHGRLKKSCFAYFKNEEYRQFAQIMHGHDPNIKFSSNCQAIPQFRKFSHATQLRIQKNPQ